MRSVSLCIYKSASLLMNGGFALVLCAFHGSYRTVGTLNVLEFHVVAEVPSNILEFHLTFETDFNFLMLLILAVSSPYNKYY